MVSALCSRSPEVSASLPNHIPIIKKVYEALCLNIYKGNACEEE